MSLLDVCLPHGLIQVLELAVKHIGDTLAYFSDLGLQQGSQVLLKERVNEVLSHDVHYVQNLLLELFLLEMVLLYLHA